MSALQYAVRAVLALIVIAANTAFVVAVCRDIKEPACKPTECSTYPFPCEGYAARWGKYKKGE